MQSAIHEIRQKAQQQQSSTSRRSQMPEAVKWLLLIAATSLALFCAAVVIAVVYELAVGTPTDKSSADASAAKQVEREPEDRKDVSPEVRRAADLADAKLNQFSGVKLKLAHDVSDTIVLDTGGTYTSTELADDYVGHVFLGVGEKTVNGATRCVVRDLRYEARSSMDSLDYSWDAALPDGSYGTFRQFPCDALAPVTKEDEAARVPYASLVPAAHPLTMKRAQETYRQRDKELDDIYTMMPNAQAAYRPIPVFADHVWACRSKDAYENQLGRPGNSACRVIQRYTAPDFIDPLGDPNSAFYKLKLNVGQDDVETYFVHKADATFQPAFPSDGIKGSTNCRAIPAEGC